MKLLYKEVENKDMQSYRHLPLWTGILYFTIGLCGETIIGVLLLHGVNIWLLLSHVFAVFTWSFGITLMYNREAQLQDASFSRHDLVNKWGLSALILGLCTFPGSGALAYSVALAITSLVHRSMGNTSKNLEQTLGKLRIAKKTAQSTVASLREDAGIETKQFAIVKLSHQGTPEAMQMLRHLLVDPHAEIRTDASVTLTRLEEQLSHSLNSALQQWMTNPEEKENTLHLANSYYQYASSNVLDEASQHFYFVKAQNLLQQLASQGTLEPNSWLQLAHIYQRLNKLEEALQAVQIAIKLNLHAPDAYLLAMELAYSLHNWDNLIAIANAGISVLPETSEIAESLQWWAHLQAQKQGEAVYA